MTGHLDEAWARTDTAEATTHRARVTFTESLALRSLDWGMVAELPEQTWSVPLAPGEHDVRLVTSRIGSTATQTQGLVADILLVGELHGEPPTWERAGPDLPFRRGVAVVPDLSEGDAPRTAAGSTWEEARRLLETFTFGEEGEFHVAVEVFPAPFWERRSDTGHVALAATPCAAVPGSPERSGGVAYELVTHGPAQRWLGRREGRTVAVALDIGAGIRGTLDGVELIADPWLQPVGAPVPSLGTEAGSAYVPDPEGDPADWMPYTDAFVPERHPSERAVTASIGEVRFPSGVVTVVNPTSPELATELVVALPTDRSLPCFLAPSYVAQYADVLVRIGDTTPVEWRHSQLREDPPSYGDYGRGLIALCDRSLSERLRSDEKYAKRVSEMAFSASPLLLRSEASGDPLGVVIHLEGNLPVFPLLGLDSDGAVTAIALNAADASDISYARRSL